MNRFMLFLLLGVSFGVLGKPVPDSSSVHILRFSTYILHKDSSWNVNNNIFIPTQPSLITISIEDKSDKAEPDFICVLTESVTMYDTLKMGNNRSILLNNLQGGDYELKFVNLNNQKAATISFKVASAFWQRWWFAPVVFLIISAILSIIFYFFYLIRLRQQLHLQRVRHELEIKALRAQMNPHFIFNSMNTIDAYILRKRFVEASDCLQKFSKLIRKILENSESQTVSISQDFETLRLYIELEQERFSHSFQYRFDVDPVLIEKDYQIPPLLIQPFVENAILHGVRNLQDGNGLILVKLSRMAEHTNKKVSELLLCEIEDNGIGRAASNTLNLLNERNHKSLGLDITLERISTYQALYGDKMQTSITDLEKGTRVEIKLPLTLN